MEMLVTLVQSLHMVFRYKNTTSYPINLDNCYAFKTTKYAH